MYKLIQLGYGLFGVGQTPDEAQRNSMQWLDNPGAASDAEFFDNTVAVFKNCNHGDLIIVSDHVANELGEYS